VSTSVTNTTGSTVERHVQLGMTWLPEQAGNGLDRYFFGLTRHLLRQGIDCQALVAGWGAATDGMKTPEPMFFSTPSASFLHRMRGVRAAYRCAEQVNPQLIATHFALFALPVLRRIKRRPHVVHFHGPWSLEHRREGGRGVSNMVKRWIERRVYATGDRFITLSQAFADVLCEHYGVDPQRVRVIPGGIDAAAFAPDPGSSREETRVQLGWPTDRRVVLCVRRLAARMGLEALIDAAGALREKHPDLLVLIAGKGRLKESLEERIKSKRLTDHVKLLGFVPDEDLPTAYRAAEVSVVPTRALEGFGLVTLESLAAGTPCLVTPVGGLPEAVGGLSRELILAGCESSDIAAGLDRALDDPAALPDAETCRRYVREHFDWSVIAPRVLEVYREAVEGWGKAEGRR